MQLNPRDPTFRANPYPAYQRLREVAPISFRPQQNDWLITRYADIVALLKDNHIGHFDEALPAPDESQWQHLSPKFREFAKVRDESQRLTKLWINVKNPPVHTRLHKLFHSAFTQQQVNELVPRVQAIADELLDSVASKGELDIIQDFASPFTASVIAEILDIPLADRLPLMRWSRTLAISIDLDRALATYESGQLALVGFTQYFRKLIASKQIDLQSKSRQSGSNFVNLMLQAQMDDLLTEDELLANYSLLFLTGHSTTQHVIGNGMLALLRHPEQLKRLQAEPAILETAVDECLRYDCSAQFISRTVLADLEWDGNTLCAGQQIHLVLGAGNRDPEQFPNPEMFDIGRLPNRHLTFGHGMHYCIGARLAKLVAGIGIGTLVRRLPQIAFQNKAPVWEDSYLIHGLKSLPVQF